MKFSNKVYKFCNNHQTTIYFDSGYLPIYLETRLILRRCLIRFYQARQIELEGSVNSQSQQSMIRSEGLWRLVGINPSDFLEMRLYHQNI